MADPIPVVARGKQVGDDWTTIDANAGPRASERHVPAFEQEHTKAGIHLYPAASAAALVTWSGGSYSYTWSVGLAGGPIFDGVGVVRFSLSLPMRSADHWMAVAHPVDPEPYGAEEDAEFAKTQTTSRIRIYDHKKIAAHKSFLLLVYGVRL